MEELESKEELINFLLYKSFVGGDLRVGVNGDARIDNHLSDELEEDVREIINDE